MVSKKLKLLLALVGLIQIASYAQDTTKKSTSMSSTDANWAYDSSKVSTKNMPHYNEFTNYQTPYPAKPRRMWELGLSGGLSMIIGDIDPQAGIGGGLSIRKALGHVVSLRASWNGSINYGLDYRLRYTTAGTSAPDGSNPWTHYTRPTNGQYPSGRGYVANYRNIMHALSLDALFSLNTSSYYRGNPKVDWYAIAGYSFTYSDVDVINGQKGQNVNFANIDYNRPRKDIKSDLKNAGIDHGLFDLSNDKYTNAPVGNGNRNSVGLNNNNQLERHALDVGIGFAFKLSPKTNIGIEEKLTMPFDDNWDGLYAGTSQDFLTSTQLRLNFNIGNPKKDIEPLWWVNPNNYIYNEIATPKHMKFPPVVLPDADGDGVTDQFDMEPNTPAGCAVDVHGVSLDTDGDGVPDCRDKEKLTPQNCFPVNADGVGTCPEPECCKNIQQAAPPSCSLGSLPSVQFKGGSASISTTAQSLLNTVAQQLMANPNCKVKLVGYGASTKKAQQLSWDHVNAVKTYLTEKQGISETRIIFTYGMEGDANTVDLVPTMEEGPNTVPAPHPNLRKG
jgi:outer membrane protein OmpA-like peptidoglycan-associated protein